MANPVFNSRGGTYDQQTEVMFNKQLYREYVARTFVGSLSRRNDIIAGKTAFETPSFDASSFIWSQEINSGDEKRITLSEVSGGNGTYGDVETASGDFVEFKSQAFRLNMIKSPGLQVHGRESRKLVKASIMNIPDIVRRNVLLWHAQEENYDAIRALLYGADKGLLLGGGDGGKALSLGPGSGIGAGIPLSGMHWYTTDTGFATYTPADLSAWNSTVNDAVNGIDAADADKVTLPQIEKIRQKAEDENFEPGTINGKTYKAAVLCDPVAILRLDNILGTNYKAAMPRGSDNPIFNVNYQLEFEDMLFISVPDLKKFRPAYNATNAYIDIGPGFGDTDPRKYTTTSDNALMIFIGAGALLRGTDGAVELLEGNARFGPKDGMAISGHTRRGFVRNQWESKDGRTESYCRSVITACFYEPGIDWS